MQEDNTDRGRAFEERLGTSFQQGSSRKALTHQLSSPELRRSGSEEAVPAVLPRDNERLEFLGDAVLELLTATSWRLFRSERRAASRARADRKCSFPGDGCTTGCAWGALEVGRGKETGGRDKQTLLADAFEAVVAAVYLMADWCGREGVAKGSVRAGARGAGERISESDRKSALQELFRGRGGRRRSIAVAERAARPQKVLPDRKSGLTGVHGDSEGSTKKEAEQRPASEPSSLFAPEAKGQAPMPSAPPLFRAASPVAMHSPSIQTSIWKTFWCRGRSLGHDTPPASAPALQGFLQCDLRSDSEMRSPRSSSACSTNLSQHLARRTQSPSR